MNIQELVDAVKEKTKMKYYKIATEKSSDLSIFDSKFGGVPYWDFKLDYPKSEDGENMVLIAQINFEKEKFNDERLPDKGILQFFIAINDDVYGMNFDKQNNQNNWRVVYHERINPDAKESDIKEKGIKEIKELSEYILPFEDTYKITFKEEEGGITFMDDSFNKVVLDVLKEKFNIEPTDGLHNYLKELDEDYYDKFPGWGHQLLGYPSFTQYDPRENKKEYQKYDLLLMQIDSEGDIMWGDSGVANFFINEKDLLNRDFSDILYNWDCY